MPPSLSVVIPVYNEPGWIATVVADLVTAQQRSLFTDVELIVVDDGSDEETKVVLAGLSAPFPVRIIAQENAGRFGARRTGVAAAGGELVLLIDSRVSIGPDALRFVADHLTDTGDLPVWNAHVEVDVKGNPYARFWNVLTEAAFSEYFGNPRTTSFGLEEFDRFPKGTTCFLAPRVLLQDAIDGFHSYYEDARDANDDTILIRTIAGRQRINISPGFWCLYRSRDSLGPFLRHAFHRGGVFVDGYGRPGTRFFPLIVSFFPVSMASLVFAARRPRTAMSVASLAPVAAAGAGVAMRRPRADVAALAALAPLWATAYGAGIWRGALLALRARVRGVASSTR